MSQNHPDKLVAKGLPEEMMRLAKEKTQKISKAYETIQRQLIIYKFNSGHYGTCVLLSRRNETQTIRLLDVRIQPIKRHTGFDAH